MNNAMLSRQVSVIVPAYNAASCLPDCLQALLCQQTSGEEYSLSLEIIVVDDGSSDQTAQVARGYQARGVRLLQQPHAGAAAARNTGVKGANPGSQILLFTDADCVPVPTWALRMTLALEQVGPEVAGIKGAYRTRQISPVARFIQAEFEERYARLIQHHRQPEFADTYSAAYRRSLLEKYPFDQTLPGAIVEDAELGWRLRQAGYSFEFEPEALVYHRHATRFTTYFRRKFRIGYWRIALYRRYPAQLSAGGHTSQLAKLQMVFSGLVVANLIWAGLSGFLPIGRAKARRMAGLTFGIGILNFLALELSFYGFLKRLRHNQPEPKLLVVGWLMLNIRALALSAGAVTGVGHLVLERLKGHA